MASSNGQCDSCESAQEQRETPKQRNKEKERLARRRVRDSARQVAASTEQREARLQQRRDRRAAESTEHREARLQQRRHKRAAESTEQREARLLQLTSETDGLMRQLNREKLDGNMPVKGTCTDASGEEPFKQRFVQLKMRSGFHDHFACLSSPSHNT